jgi:hypothetical protein
MKRAFRRPRLLAAGSVLALLALGLTGLTGLAAPAMAATSCSVTWTGDAGNGSWSTAGNWSTDKVPTASSNVCIPTLTTADATPPISINSLQLAEGASLIIGSGNFSVATSVSNQGFIMMTGTALSAASITLSSLGNISAYGNSSITSPALSNAGNVTVGTGGTLRLADNPLQLQNGILNGGTWLDYGVLVVPSDISQVTSEGTVLTVDGLGSAVETTSGGNALAALTSVGAGTAFSVVDDASLTVAQGLTSQGVVNVGSGIGGSLTVDGTFTQASGGSTGLEAGTLTATSISVQSGGTLDGSGTVTGPVTNNGTVEPEGSLTITGTYSQTASGTLSEQFSSTLNVSSTATLAGALNVTVNPKHVPPAGSSYTALTFSSLTGAFTTVTTGYTLTTSATNIKVTKQ